MAITVKPDEKGITAKVEKYRSYSTSYIIETDDPLTNPLAVIVALATYGIRKGNYALWDLDCICKDVSFNQEEQKIWKATASWSNEPGEAGKDEDGKPVDNPLDAYPIVSFTAREIEIQLKADINGKEFNNAAGEPLIRDSNTAVIVNRTIITVETNEEDFDGEDNDYFSATTNSNSYFGYNPRRVIFKYRNGVTAEWTDEDNVTQQYWKVTTVLECLNALEPPVVPLELANMGMKINHPDDGLINIITGEGTENAAQATEPVPLSIAGDSISFLGVNYIEFENYTLEEYDFFDEWGIG